MSLTKIPSIPTPIQSSYRAVAALLFAASLLLLTFALLRHSTDLAQPSPHPFGMESRRRFGSRFQARTTFVRWGPPRSQGDSQPSPGRPNARPGASPSPGPTVTGGAPGAPYGVGDPLPRIQCPQGYTATVYAEGLSSPDGLAFSPAGILHVAEEPAGRVSQVGPTGRITPIITDNHTGYRP
jgi:hypothetical protein